MPPSSRAFDSLSRLPTRWEGYEGVDIVVISTSNPKVFAEITPNDDRVEALEQWVRMGGKLVLCAGSHAAEALQTSAPLGEIRSRTLPRNGAPRGARRPGRPLPRAANPIPPPKTGEKTELPTARLTTCKAKSRPAGPTPLVIRSPRGLGQVVFVATDLDRGPISDWNDR